MTGSYADFVARKLTMTEDQNLRGGGVNEKQMFLWVDQFGNTIYAKNLTELKGEVGRSSGAKANPIYRDTASGRARVGYAIGGRWFRKYAPVVEVLP